MNLVLHVDFWSQPHRLEHFPAADNLTSIAVTDLLGNGTACLVWSSPLASDVRSPMRYIDLMGGQKPHLLVYTNKIWGRKPRFNTPPPRNSICKTVWKGIPG